MMLLNMIYILDFMINIVVNSILKNEELHFDTQHGHFHRNDSNVFLILKVKAHYIFKNNKIFERMIIFATFIRADFTHD